METRLSYETGMRFDYIPVRRFYEPEALLATVSIYKRARRKLTRETN